MHGLVLWRPIECEHDKPGHLNRWRLACNVRPPGKLARKIKCGFVSVDYCCGCAAPVLSGWNANCRAGKDSVGANCGLTAAAPGHKVSHG